MSNRQRNKVRVSAMLPPFGAFSCEWPSEDIEPLNGLRLTCGDLRSGLHHGCRAEQLCSNDEHHPLRQMGQLRFVGFNTPHIPPMICHSPLTFIQVWVNFRGSP